MSNNRFNRGATTLKTQPLYAPSRSASRTNYRNPKIHRATPRYAAKWRLVIPKQLWAVLLIVGLIGGLGWFVFGSRYFKIAKIEIVGPANDAVQAEINTLYGANILTYATSGMTAKLKTAQSSIKDLHISKGLPRTLRVAVDLRTPVMRWQHGDVHDLLDDEGTVFQYAGAELNGVTIESLPNVIDLQNQIVMEGHQLMSRQFVTFIGQTNSFFVSRFPIPIDHFEIGQSSFEVTLVTKDGWKALLDTTRQPEPELQALQQVFEHFHADIHEYVDLRVSGRAYFK